MLIRNPQYLTVSALCGALGVLSGYAIYLTYLQVAGPDAEPHASLRFWLTLLVTGIIAYLIEWVREVIREGRIEHASHPIFRTVGTFVIVLLFELFVTGFHTSSDLSLADLRGASNRLLGPQDSSATWTLIAAAGMWIAVGALLAIWLSRSVRTSTEPSSRRIALAAGNGIAGGLLFAPLFMGLYIVADRSLVALIGVFHEFGGSTDATTFLNPFATLWHNIGLSQNSFLRNAFDTVLAALAIPLGLLDLAAQHSLWIFLAVFLPIIALDFLIPAILFPAIAQRIFRKSHPIRHPALRTALCVVWIIALAYSAGPFAIALFRVLAQLAHWQQLLTLLRIISLAAFLWAVPGALLGALTPLLRRVSSHTRNWAFVGYGAALLLVVATIWAHAWWPLIPALAAAAVGYLFQRGSSVHEYWPFAALCVAAGVCGATSITQHFTFATEVHDLHAIDILQPTPAGPPDIAGRFLAYDQLTPAERDQVANSSATTLAVVHAEDGRTLYVPLWNADAVKVQQMAKILQHFQPQMDAYLDAGEADRQKTSDATLAAEQKIIASGLSPLLEAEVARVNQPGADTTPDSTHKKAVILSGTTSGSLSKEPAFTNDDPALKGLGNPLLPGGPISPNDPQPTAPTSDTAPASSASTAASPADSSAPSTSSQPTQAGAPSTPNAGESPTTTPPTTDATKSATNAASNPATKSADDSTRAAEALELSLSGSVGFWVTVGLLACWSIHEAEPESPSS